MKIALTILIGLHGIIHLFGFLKALGISEFHAISQPISKTYGVIWLLAFLLFAVTVVLILIHSDYWWLTGFLAVIISQILIFNFWSDAKFGSIANLIILISTIAAYSAFSFNNMVREERKTLFENSKSVTEKVITAKSISGLPIIIQKWFTNIGLIGANPISNVHLVQELQLKLNQEQVKWNNGKAEQYFTINPPAFNWNINTEMNSILSVVGRDKFENGNGEMTIKLLSLISVANAKNSNKVNQATLQRFLAEIVWFPSAALSDYITWEQVDENSAKATMVYSGTKVSGIFHFDSGGIFKKFAALRYKDVKDSEPKLWTVSVIKTEERNGIKIPVELKVDWEIEKKKWTWLKIKIKDIEYNVNKMQAADNG